MLNHIKAARHCLSNSCGGCPFNNLNKPCAEAFAEYITKCVDGFVDIESMKEVATHDATIITADGVKGFMWIDEEGNQHQEDGFIFPEVRITKGTVQELISDTGERSAAWSIERTDI